jgi:hypothetical protein
VHVAIRLSSLEEANAAVVGIAHQPGKPFLSQMALYLAAEASGSKCEPSYLDSGFSQGHPICRGLAFCSEREASTDERRSELAAA